MNKKIVGILICLMLVAMITPALGDTDTIDVTLNPQATADIEVDESSWNPSCGLAGDESTAGDWATLTNNGLVQVDVTIKANNTNDWILSSSPGHDQFVLDWTQVGSEQTYEEYTASRNDYNSNGGTQTFTVGSVGTNETFYCTKAVMQLRRAGGDSGTYNVSISKSAIMQIQEVAG